jgi:Na+/melibiose symporter-like transporter
MKLSQGIYYLYFIIASIHDILFRTSVNSHLEVENSKYQHVLDKYQIFIFLISIAIPILVNVFSRKKIFLIKELVPVHISILLVCLCITKLLWVNNTLNEIHIYSLFLGLILLALIIRSSRASN